MSHPASALITRRGERVALCDVSVSAALHDLLSEVTVSQTYRNDESVNIEAVYTFPLPLDAVLLELSVTIGKRVLTGVVVEKKAAEARYEDAVAAGDAAVMLEQLEPGLYTMNVGNLLPAETAVITFKYAVMYRWAGDTLRMLIPTTIAPRFGDSPHAPHQVPESSLTVENQFSLQVNVFGSLREARFECPSHEVTLASSSDKTMITLSREKAVMDRDFILNVKAPQAAHSFALCGADGADEERETGAAVVASFLPVFPGLRQPRALDLAVVIDCSGSMQGDSIAQARQALAGILDALQPRDRVTIVAFGNSTKELSNQLLPCTDANLRRAREFAAALEADMGGTEIGNALQAAYKATTRSESADIFIVTDGEVSEWTSVVADAKRSGRRIFTVGVGNAVSEAFVRELAAATGGESELVSPREGMADRVIRHFERMRAPRARRVTIHWPGGARDLTPASFGAVFEGDTVLASAQFDGPTVGGQVALEIETDRGDVFRHELPIGKAPALDSGDRVSTVARLAAASRLKELDREAGAAMALRYRLASAWTNWLVVAERADGEKAFDIPALRKVPQTLAAGWGGTGVVGALFLGKPAFADFSASLEVDSLSVEEPSFMRASSLASEEQGEDLLQRLQDLDRAVGALADEARGIGASLEAHAKQIEGALHEMGRRIDDIQRALDELAREPRASRHLDAIHERLEQVVALREWLRELLREVNRLLTSAVRPPRHTFHGGSQ
jgi:Ca-activated chloride channel family protein